MDPCQAAERVGCYLQRLHMLQCLRVLSLKSEDLLPNIDKYRLDATRPLTQNPGHCIRSLQGKTWRQAWCPEGMC